MTTRFFTATWALTALLSPAAYGQTVAVPVAPQPLAFQSALQGYQPFQDEKSDATPGDWKAANDTTARIGGWRAYAREASAPATPTESATPSGQPSSGAAKP